VLRVISRWGAWQVFTWNKCIHICCCWSLFSALEWLTVLHVILHEWLAFCSAFEYPPKWWTYSKDMVGATWNCCCLSTFWEHHFMPSHIHVFSCNLPPAFWAEWLESFMCYCGNTGVEWILKQVSTESGLWRRNSPTGMMNWCLMSSDVMRHIRDKLWPMPKHGAINLYVHGNQKAH